MSSTKQMIKHYLKTIAEESKDGITIDSMNIARRFGTDHRIVRQILSELRHELVLFIPLGKQNPYHYTLYVEGNVHLEKLLEKYVRSEIASIKTQYFNNVVKMKKMVKDNDLIRKIGQIQMILEEGE